MVCFPLETLGPFVLSFHPVGNEGWFFGLPWPEITPPIACPLRARLSLSLSGFEFSFDFPLFFFVFLSTTCCGAWLCRYTAVDLCVGFRVGDLDNRVVLTRHKSHIKSNPCSLICFIKSGILGILGILGLSIV